MNDREGREFEMAVFVLLFLTTNVADFDGIQAIADAIAILEAETRRLRELGAEKISATGAAKDKTIHKGDLRDALRDAMQDVADMWKPMAKNYQNSENKFRMPNGSDQLMIDTAGSFIADAAPLTADFKGRGMPGDFVTKLTAKRAAFDAVVNESEAARLKRIGVNSQFREPLKKCLAVVADVDPIVKMIYRDNPAKCAEWLTASRVRKA